MDQVTEINIPQMPPPKGAIAHMRCARFGTIFTNMCYASACVLMLALIALVAVPIIQIVLMFLTFFVLMCMVLFSLGTIFLDSNNSLGKVADFAQSVMDSSMAETVKNTCIKALPYLCIIGIAAAVVGIVMLSIKFQRKNIGRIVGVSAVASVLVVVLLLFFGMGGSL